MYFQLSFYHKSNLYTLQQLAFYHLKFINLLFFDIKFILLSFGKVGRPRDSISPLQWSFILDLMLSFSLLVMRASEANLSRLISNLGYKMEPCFIWAFHDSVAISNFETTHQLDIQYRKLFYLTDQWCFILETSAFEPIFRI